MPLESDLKLDASKFRADAISAQTQRFNDDLIEIGKQGPKWFEVGAEKYRKMRANGETPMPKPTYVESAIDGALPSREKGRSIPIRVFHPESGKAKGVFYHIHGGGWVLQDEKSQDLMLKSYADKSSLTVVSVGYRLAPEHPYPQGNEDCFDIGEYLIDNSQREYGVPLMFLGGDSAGGHLSAVTCFHLLQARPNFAFRGLILNFGAYDLSPFLPGCWNFREGLILDLPIMQRYVAAYCPNMSDAEIRNPKVSPFYADLNKMKLPPALFTCGTSDPLLDDSVFMSTKWMMSGAEAILKLYPGAPHGFTFFPVGGTEQTEVVLKDIATFMNDRS